MGTGVRIRGPSSSFEVMDRSFDGASDRFSTTIEASASRASGAIRSGRVTSPGFSATSAPGSDQPGLICGFRPTWKRNAFAPRCSFTGTRTYPFAYGSPTHARLAVDVHQRVAGCLQDHDPIVGRAHFEGQVPAPLGNRERSFRRRLDGLPAPGRTIPEAHGLVLRGHRPRALHQPGRDRIQGDGGSIIASRNREDQPLSRKGRSRPFTPGHRSGGGREDHGEDRNHPAQRQARDSSLLPREKVPRSGG